MTKSTCGWSIYLLRSELKEDSSKSDWRDLTHSGLNKNSSKLGWRKTMSFKNCVILARKFKQDEQNYIVFGRKKKIEIKLAIKSFHIYMLQSEI